MLFSCALLRAWSCLSLRFTNFMVFRCHELSVQVQHRNIMLPVRQEKRKNEQFAIPKAYRQDEEAQCIMLQASNQKHMWCCVCTGVIFPRVFRNTEFSAWLTMSCISVEIKWLRLSCWQLLNLFHIYYIFEKNTCLQAHSACQETCNGSPHLRRNIITSLVTNHCLPVWSKCSIQWSVKTDVALEPNDANIKSPTPQKCASISWRT